VTQDANSSDRADRVTNVPSRAAQYVRMSTEHQQYSTENQAAAIEQHAKSIGAEIVRTYADSGKSGLNIDGRDALKQLIDDVQAGRADFETILVYDVSRWGRFQDADEGAYYEYICRRVGIGVEYCAEQFRNDGSVASTIVKTVKRAMAGEYSRELSVKVFAGQCRLIELGYRQGGTAGFGLRRFLVDSARRPKAELSLGEQKSLQTDRVILVPGPEQEVDLVRRIYRMFVLQGKREQEIATVLNNEGHETDFGRAWTRGTVHQVLTAEKYVGNNVFNRISFKLKKRRIVNEPEQWIRADGAFDGIVDPDFFDAARRIISDRSRRLTDDQMLERLKLLFGERGWISGLVIDESEGMPSSSAYRSRFGSLLRAYQLVGFTPPRDYRYIEINRALRRMHPDVLRGTIAAVEEYGGRVRCDPVSDVLAVNDEFTASVVIARCRTTDAGSLRWKIRLDVGLRPDITLAVRMEPDNQHVRDCYLLPRIDVLGRHVRLAEDNGIYLDAYRFDCVEAFGQICARSPLRSAA